MLKIEGPQGAYKGPDGQTVSAEELRRRMGEQMSERRKEDKRLGIQQKEDVVLVVGICGACQGEIVYHSSFGPTVSVDHVRIGGRNPMREHLRCSCKECGLAYDPHFPKFRDQVVLYRNRK